MEGISERFFSIVNVMVPLSLSEAETETYPYAVYSHNPTYYTTKDSNEPYKAVSDVSLTIYGQDFEQISDLSSKVCAKILEGMNGEGFGGRLTRTAKNCEEGTWYIEMDFEITQLF